VQDLKQNVFLWVNYFDPHFTYDPPAPFSTSYDPDFTGDFRPYRYLAEPALIFSNAIEITEREKRHAWALYGGELSYLDRELGRLLAHLDDMGRLDDMLIVVVSDHGEYFGENGKYFMHDGLAEEVLKVPMILIDPLGGFDPVEPDSIAEIVDIMPTILQIVEIPGPPGIQGQSLLNDLEGKSYAFSDCGPCGKVSVRNQGSLLVLDLDSGVRKFTKLTGEGSKVPDSVSVELSAILDAWVDHIGLEFRQRIETEESERLKSLGYIQ
jgi:arylsulfatase A-like enzyme